ncbi:MAG: hypothetical protein HPY85_02855 [Anaerolineae bacterium]|nr:hypothetical protein [Anaerolineae bacterium]
MRNKIPTAVGVFFLVFVMVVIGTVSANAFPSKMDDTLSVQEVINYQATMAAYEAQQQAYEELIQQANEQLMAANATFAAIAGTNEVQPTESVGLTAEEAITIAQTVAVLPESQIGIPELVNFEGTVAYEVKYEVGAIYVSFTTGEVLLNGTITFTDEITLEQATEIAKNYLGLSSIYLADVVSINGKPVYRIIFNAGHFVYVDQTGQIVYVQMYVKDDTKPTPQATTDDDDNPSTTRTPYDDDDDDDDHEDDD